jgi:hypothetical protein
VHQQLLVGKVLQPGAVAWQAAQQQPLEGVGQRGGKDEPRAGQGCTWQK